MLRNLLPFVIAATFVVGLASQIQADILLAWNTFGNSGTETSEPSVLNDANMASSCLTLGPGVTGSANANRFGGNNWFNTGDTAGGSTLAQAFAGNDFIQFTVSPNAGFSFTATSLVFSWDRSASGPSSLVLRSSLDGFGSNLGSVTGLIDSLSTGNTLSISGVSNLSSATTFRLYGFGGTGTAGTGGFDTGSSTTNVVFNGSVSAVPEPTSIALVCLIGCSSLSFANRRRWLKSHNFLLFQIPYQQSFRSLLVAAVLALSSNRQQRCYWQHTTPGVVTFASVALCHLLFVARFLGSRNETYKALASSLADSDTLSAPTAYRRSNAEN